MLLSKSSTADWSANQLSVPRYPGRGSVCRRNPGCQYDLRFCDVCRRAVFEKMLKRISACWWREAGCSSHHLPSMCDRNLFRVSEALVEPSPPEHAEALETLADRSFITDSDGGRGFQRFMVFANTFNPLLPRSVSHCWA